MFGRVRRGSIFKSKTGDEGEAFYIIIIKNRFLLPWLKKTASIYKNWEDDSSDLEIIGIKKYDSRNYSKEVKEGILKVADREERAVLGEHIENLPEDKRRAIYGKEKLKLFQNTYEDARYGFELQNVSRFKDKGPSKLEEGLSRDLPKKGLSRDLYPKRDYKKAL